MVPSDDATDNMTSWKKSQLGKNGYKPAAQSHWNENEDGEVLGEGFWVGVLGGVVLSEGGFG